jgi:hypothetical protein
METLTFKMDLDLKKEPDQDGTFEGYGAVFGNVDSDSDIIAPGAFAKSLSVRKPKMLWQHDPNEPIGIWDELAEDEHGLRVKGRVLKDVRRGAEAMALYKAGAISGLSIGFRTISAEPEANGSVRRLTEVDLWEISAVTFPSNPKANVTAAKSDTIREFETALRDAGFSRAEAKAIAARGFTGLRDCREGRSADDAVVARLLANINHATEIIR